MQGHQELLEQQEEALSTQSVIPSTLLTPIPQWMFNTPVPPLTPPITPLTPFSTTLHFSPFTPMHTPFSTTLPPSPLTPLPITTPEITQKSKKPSNNKKKRKTTASVNNNKSHVISDIVDSIVDSLELGEPLPETASTDTPKSTSKRKKSLILKEKVRNDTGEPLKPGEILPEGVKLIFLRSYLNNQKRKELLKFIERVRNDTGEPPKPGEILPKGVKLILPSSFLGNQKRKQKRLKQATLIPVATPLALDYLEDHSKEKHVTSDIVESLELGEPLPETASTDKRKSKSKRKKPLKLKERVRSDTGKPLEPGETLIPVTTPLALDDLSEQESIDNPSIHKPSKKRKKKKSSGQAIEENLTHYPPDIQKKLKKFKIFSDDYENDKASLLKKGYNEQQCNRLILRKHSKKAIKALLDCHDDYKEKGLSHNQLIRITSRNGGSKNLEEFKIYTNSTSRCEHWRMQDLKIISNSFA